MPELTRRLFVTGATAVTARAWAQVPGAGERIRIGVIGCGSQGTAHMRTLVRMRDMDNIDILNVCDIYSKRLEAAAQLTGGKAVKDYRRVLDNPDIDYVLIATPEHWHHHMTMDAISAGKHIYCEKPMTHAIEDARRVAERSKNTPRIKMQVGVQGMSDDSYETANRHIQEGALGTVVLAQIDYSRNYSGDFWVNPIDADARPGDNLDWNAFLGPARKRPFDADRFFSWRRYWDYSGGIATDLFVHRVTRMIKSLNLTFPDGVVATGGKFEFRDSKAEIPDTLNILLNYPQGLTVQLISSMANDTPVQHLIRGHKATLRFTETGFEITPQGPYARENKPITHRKTGAEALDLHHRNLLNAIRKNEALRCDANLGYYGVVAAVMGNLSYRQRKYMRWDAAKQRALAV
ncbi:MAG TPA: Gfo/Idh/MocA family oxidoreductase [Bryobacteraceae bacterium]|nr:Gfo/Idh/MocA family oxidoreductase [Bryobacteraceae bacterium]